MDMKTAAYWTTSGLVAFAMAASAAAYITGAMDTELAHLGFNNNFALILGSWKGLAAIALLVPAPPAVRFLKEWCYAGLFFTLTGAVASHLMAGDPATSAIAPLVLGALTTVSYLFSPHRQP